MTPKHKNGSMQNPLSNTVKPEIRHYLQKMNGHKPVDLYQLVINEVEAPLLEIIMEYTGGNQTHAAEILGINRATLRKKLSLHGLG